MAVLLYDHVECKIIFHAQRYPLARFVLVFKTRRDLSLTFLKRRDRIFTLSSRMEHVTISSLLKICIVAVWGIIFYIYNPWNGDTYWGDSSDIFFLVLGITSVILVPITALLWIGWRKEHLGCTKAWLYINCGLFAFDLLTTIFTGISVALIVRSVSTIIFLLVVYNYAKMLEEKQRVELSNPIPFNRMPNLGDNCLKLIFTSVAVEYCILPQCQERSKKPVFVQADGFYLPGLNNAPPSPIILTLNHNLKAKLVFFWRQYPTGTKIWQYFPDVTHVENVVEILQIFSESRSFYFEKIMETARHLFEKNPDMPHSEIRIAENSDMFKTLLCYFDRYTVSHPRTVSTFL
ncbi:Homeobox protein prospero [Folsomia candida]|uniref:Homeobox protein prospero n=1 Tax=Folsomia candida TaxID=158441 RepID=A0A226DC79_FOLCA|nr:Homeobox protein prospero [Folsomia candida]